MMRTALDRSTLRPAFLLIVLALYVGNLLVSAAFQDSVVGPVPEWPIGVDLLILVPLLYVVLLRPSPGKAVVGVFALVSLGILVGSFAIPEEDKALWHTLEQVRWVYLGALVIAQFTLVASIVIEVRRHWAHANIESAIHASIARRVPDTFIAGLLQADARMWLYAFVRDASRFQFTQPAFTSSRHDSNASNQQAFLILVAAEIPIAHVLIALFSPTAALVVTALSVYGLIFLYADYRATLLRATTFEQDHLHIRHGVLGDLQVPYATIAAVERVNVRPRRDSSRVRFVGTGTANLRLVLKDDTQLPTLFGHKRLRDVYIGIDDPVAFEQSLLERTASFRPD